MGRKLRKLFALFIFLFGLAAFVTYKSKLFEYSQQAHTADVEPTNKVTHTLLTFSTSKSGILMGPLELEMNKVYFSTSNPYQLEQFEYPQPTLTVNTEPDEVTKLLMFSTSKSGILIGSLELEINKTYFSTSSSSQDSAVSHD